MAVRKPLVEDHWFSFMKRMEVMAIDGQSLRGSRYAGCDLSLFALQLHHFQDEKGACNERADLSILEFIS
jgi:hypothetical protein